MRTILSKSCVVIFAFIFLNFCGIECLASLVAKGHWSYYPSASIEVEIDEEILLYGTVSNSGDWTAPLFGGYLYVEENSDWTTYYDFVPEEISFGLIPGESTTIQLGTLIPKTNVPPETQFYFRSSMGETEGLDPSKDTLYPEQDLHVTVIPEPSSILLLTVGSGGLLFHRRARQRQHITRRSYEW